MNWNPISTAEENGRPVLLWIPGLGVAMCPYQKLPEPTQEEMQEYYERTGQWPTHRYLPTHWMELPEGPVSEGLQ